MLWIHNILFSEKESEFKSMTLSTSSICEASLRAASLLHTGLSFPIEGYSYFLQELLWRKSLESISWGTRSNTMNISQQTVLQLDELHFHCVPSV